MAYIGRKLFLRTCAELGVNSWNAKMLCGKSVSPDIATYINGVQLKDDFEKINKVLRLFPETTPQASDRIKQLEEALTALEKENKILRTRIENLQNQLQKTTMEFEDRLIWLENKIKKKMKVSLILKNPQLHSMSHKPLTARLPKANPQKGGKACLFHPSRLFSLST